MLHDLLIREISPADATAAAVLNEELGYPTPVHIIVERIAAVTHSADRAIFAACLGADVVGWIQVSAMCYLTAEPRAEIGGLVVAASVRGRGIGHHLVARAEQWACARGLRTMVVRSRVSREAAHRFYLREGFTQVKTVVAFSKDLARR